MLTHRSRAVWKGGLSSHLAKPKESTVQHGTVTDTEWAYCKTCHKRISKSNTPSATWVHR